MVFGPEVRCAVDLPGDAAVGKNTFWAVGRDRLSPHQEKAHALGVVRVGIGQRLAQMRES